MDLLKPSLGLILWTLVLLSLVWVLTLINIMKSDFKDGVAEKIIWIVIVILFPILGSIVYIAAASSRKIRN